VHAEHGDGAVEEPAHAEERPIAAQHDERVRARGYVAIGRDTAAAAGLVAAEGGRRIVQARSEAAIAEPEDELADHGSGQLEVGPGEYADGLHPSTARATI